MGFQHLNRLEPEERAQHISQGRGACWPLAAKSRDPCRQAPSTPAPAASHSCADLVSVPGHAFVSLAHLLPHIPGLGVGFSRSSQGLLGRGAGLSVQPLWPCPHCWHWRIRGQLPPVASDRK